jgi:TolB-like protein/Tfp pilus assembly protein PilF/predicted Ser/Thr protein kinase
MLGQSLLHYRILDQIGAGGMGIVYRAHDEKLDRDVALKVLPVGALADEAARQRFRQEALALSHLNHPNICTIYEIGESEGQTFIAMEYVEGRPLSELARGEGLPADTTSRYGRQIAEALAHAHERGILHRDLKGSNVMVTPEGRVKLLDFGLAKRLRDGPAAEETRSQGLTEVGAVVGTLHYMAPEVLEGRPADARSDVWALGVTLYEMAAGELPFRGPTGFAVSSAILREPLALSPRIAPALGMVIQRCLAKAPGERYQTAGEVRAALEAAQSGATIAAGPLPRPAVTRRWWLAVPVAAALVALAWLGWSSRDRLRASAPAGRIESLAVLPLDNFSRDPEQAYFADGMTEQLTADLAQISALRVISRTSVMQYKGARKPLPEIAKDLKVDAVIEGSVMRSGDRVRITAQLVQVGTGAERHLWAESYERDLRDVLALQSEVARDIANQIRITLTPQEQARLGHRRPVDPEVYQLYLKGRYYANQDGEEPVRKGIGFFNQAIAKDSSYAPAHAGLSLAYGSLGNVFSPPREVMPKAKAEALLALQLDETLSEAHTSLASVMLFYDWDWAGAEKELKRALELNPSSAEARDLYGNLLTAIERYPEGVAESRRAFQLDPLSLRIHGDLMFNLLASRQYDEAIADSRRAIERDPKFATAYAVMGLALAQKRQFPDAIKALEKATELDTSYNLQLFLAHVQAVAGNKTESRKLLAKVEELSKHQYVCAYEISSVHVSLGDNNKGLEWLEKGRQQRCDCLVWLKSEPWMDPLRVDPRYVALVKQVGFPPGGAGGQ